MTKSLIASLFIIILLFALSAFLSFACMSTVNELLSLASALPDNVSSVDASLLESIDSLWSRRRGLIALMAKLDLVVNTDVSVKTLCAYGASDSDGDYQYALNAFFVNLNAIAENQGVSLEAVF